jgi:hypothetical protein
VSQTPIPTPAAKDPKAGMKGKIFLFRQNAIKAGLSDEEINLSVSEFETTEDIDTALSFFNDKTGPAVLVEKQKELETKHNTKLKVAGTPPDQLPESAGVEPVVKFNSRAVENLQRMNIMSGAVPTLRFNPVTGDMEVL